MSDEENKPFTVSDRRHFTPGGGVRTEDAPPPEASPESAPPSEHAGAEDGFPPTLTALVVSVAGQAAQALGASELKLARSHIDLIEMLETKTRGNRTTDEDRILSEVLFQLRMAWVDRSRGVA